jgi:leucyl aminopeptidase
MLSEAEIKLVKNDFSKKMSYSIIQSNGRTVFIFKKEKGKTKFQHLENMRKISYASNKELNRQKISGIEIFFDVKEESERLAFIDGFLLSNYQFLKYFSDKNEKKNSLQEIALIAGQVKKEAVLEIQNLVNAVFTSRDLVNEPLSYLTAPQLSKEIAGISKSAGFKFEFFDKKKITALKMGGLLSVNKGSVDPPTFNILEYKSPKAKNKKPIVLVGKGVVYDTGGLSLKPTANSMDMMKCDMAGAAAVVGLFKAIASNKLPIHVIGLIPATDNRPGGNAYVPGDVIVMHSGKTVEMLNADAEGRMILADALSYAKKYQPELVIDLATLTGAAAAAIGKEGMVGMGTASEETMSALKKSGNQVHERIAEMPFWDEYGTYIKSDVADIKNIGGPHAGAITAGKFLECFIDYPWIHLDIAGPAFLTAEDSYRGKGGSGVGVRLLYDFLSTYK